MLVKFFILDDRVILWCLVGLCKWLLWNICDSL
jgi:hypothetical protein